MYLSPIVIFLGPWLIGSIATYYFSDYSVIFNNLSSTGTWYISLVTLFLFYTLIIFNIQRRQSVNLEKIIGSFFDNVIVNHEDKKLKSNRLALLNKLSKNIKRFAKFEMIAD